MAFNRGGYKGRRRNESRAHLQGESEKMQMLHTGRVASFRYGIKEIMSYYRVSDDVASSVIATVTAKASRVSVSAARAFVLEQEKTGAYPREASDDICRLLDKYSKMR